MNNEHTATQVGLKCTLTDQEKENLKELYKEFKEKNDSNKEIWVSKANEKLNEFRSKYKDKISDGKLTLDEYTNILKTDENTKIKTEYLCDFLENRSDVFGGARPTGSADSYMVKKNDEERMEKGKKVFNGPYTIASLNKRNATKDEAEKAYDAEILPLLKEIVDAVDDEKIKALEENALYTNYKANQIKRKMVVINNILYNRSILEQNKNKSENKTELNDYFGHFYDEKKVDQLMAYFFVDQEFKDYSFFDKSKLLVRTLKIEILASPNKDENSLWETFLISNFLWNLANAKDMASESNPNVILYGAPGTGKTYKVKNMIEFLCKGDKSRYVWAQFHPNYSYEDFIEGIKPTGIDEKTGAVQLELINGSFKELCKNARISLEKTMEEKLPDVEYYFIADEINRANLSAVLGETLSILEASYRDYRREGKENKSDKRNLINAQYTELEKKLKGDEKKIKCYDEKFPGMFGIPRNVRFIGMMNDVDKSIDAFDLALRRRFKWIRETCDYKVIRNVLEDSIKEGLDKYIDSCMKLNQYISEELKLGPSYEFGHSNFLKMGSICRQKKITENNKIDLFENYLSPTLKEYLRSYFPEEEIKTKLDDARNIFLGIEKTQKNKKGKDKTDQIAIADNDGE